MTNYKYILKPDGRRFVTIRSSLSNLDYKSMINLVTVAASEYNITVVKISTGQKFFEKTVKYEVKGLEKDMYKFCQKIQSTIEYYNDALEGVVEKTYSNLLRKKDYFSNYLF